jgi:hypothetical protein
MRIPSAQSIPMLARVVIAGIVVTACAAMSFTLGLDVVRQGALGMAAAVGIVTGLYMIAVTRPGFLRWTEGRGIWPALLITYGIRVLVGIGSFVGVPRVFCVPDIYIGVLSMGFAGTLLKGVGSPNVVAFGATIIDAFFQHAVLLTFFALVLAIVKPFSAEPDATQRGFEVLNPL